MLQKSSEQAATSTLVFSDRLKRGLAALRQSFDYARDLDRDPWEFAVAIQTLETLGINQSDLRWLTLKGMIRHAREVTVQGDDGRAFRPTGNLTFCEQTCVVLTEPGFSRLHHHRPADSVASCVLPSWDMDSRRLLFDGILVKSFKWRAANQEVVLSAFEEEGWPTRIDDPLPPHAEQDSRRRLSDTIKCLNQKQHAELLRFHGDGTGEGVVWEACRG